MTPKPQNAAPAARFNTWPLAIVAAFAVFIGATITLIVIACSHPTELVQTDYYERELQFQQEIDRHNRTRELGQSATINFDSRAGRIQISIPPGHVPTLSGGSIQLYRPSSAHLDHEIPLRPDPNGSQSVDASTWEPGRWRVQVDWSVFGQDYSLRDELVLARRPAPVAHP